LNFETIARPYAQAIYDHSEGWEVDLEQLELALKTPEVQMLIDSPKLAYKEKTEVFLSLFEGQIDSKTSNLVKVLGESKRISLIPHISKEYRKLLSGTKSSSEVVITSAFELSAEQLEKVTDSLKGRYGDSFTVAQVIDNSLVGGFSIKCGDEVTDYSIKGKLEKLRNQIK
jgi:F-type H+-transporting ATPase subunit delta